MKSFSTLEGKVLRWCAMIWPTQTVVFALVDYSQCEGAQMNCRQPLVDLTDNTVDILPLVISVHIFCKNLAMPYFSGKYQT